MALLTDLRIAFMNLVVHARRTAFLSAAVAAVTFLFVLLVSLSTGIRDTMINTATTLTTGHLNVGGFYKVTARQAAPMVTDYDTVAAIVRQNLPEMDFMVQRGRGWGKVVSDSGSSVQALMSGLDIAAEPAFKGVVEVISGDLDELAKPNTLLLFEQQAKRLEVKVGDAVTLSASTAGGAANTIDCRVVAIAREVGIWTNFLVYVSNESLRRLYQLRADVTGVLQIQVKPRYLGDLNALAVRLRQRLAQAGYAVMEPDPEAYVMKLETVASEDWTGQKLDVSTWEDELSLMMWTFRALQSLSFVLLLILLVIMAAGIMNTFWIAVRERTREIGTLRAIGMQRTGVVRLFLLEAVLLGIFGATTGVALGALATWLINVVSLPVPVSVQLFLMRSSLHLALELRTLAAGILLITIVTGAAAVYPAVRAARRRPVDAMAHFS
jgi:ABC-type lipoprotein release transport system permease subunit